MENMVCIQNFVLRERESSGIVDKGLQNKDIHVTLVEKRI